MTLDFAYTLFLILQKGDEVPKIEVKRYIQKWFILSTLTGRYIGSPESQMDRDLRGISSKGFISFLKENEDALLSDAFWNVRLVQNLETSSINSPYFSTFIAAQIFNGDRSLLSNSCRVSDLVSIAGDIHHIFPKEYLKESGHDEKSIYNQVANYTYFDTVVNIAVGKKAPNEYFKTALEQCNTGNILIGTITDKGEYLKNLEANCIPTSIVEMKSDDYLDFLKKRRSLMAAKIKAYYYSL